MEDYYLVSKMLFVIVAAISLGAVAWQLFKLLGETTETVKELKGTNKRVNLFLDKVSSDYEYISTTIKGLSTTIDRLNQEVLSPITNLSHVFRSVENVSKSLWSRFRSEPEPDDYLPERM